MEGLFAVVVAAAVLVLAFVCVMVGGGGGGGGGSRSTRNHGPMRSSASMKNLVLFRKKESLGSEAALRLGCDGGGLAGDVARRGNRLCCGREVAEDAEVAATTASLASALIGVGCCVIVYYTSLV